MTNTSHFRKWQKQHPNFMTPHIKKLYENHPYILELSEGTDFNHNTIYGITTFRVCGDTYNNNTNYENQMSRTLTEALTIFNTIKQQIKEELQNAPKN